jgi:hypothetical protein
MTARGSRGTAFTLWWELPCASASGYKERSGLYPYLARSLASLVRPAPKFRPGRSRNRI